MSLRRTVLYQDLLEDISEFVCKHHFQTANQPISEEELMSLLTNPDIDHRTYAALNLARTVFKKFEDESNAKADAVALDKFLASNIRCQNWSLDPDRSLEEDLLLGLFKDEIYKFFNPNPRVGHILDMNDILANGICGPGASVEARGTDFYTKFASSPLSTTSSSLFTLFEHYTSKVPYWGPAEKIRSASYGNFSIVRGNRLTFVPKNVDTSRCICTEPLLNMYFQQGIKAILERRLRQYFGIDLATQQECNRDLARIGSVKEDYCTIDLSAASDSVSLKMVRSTFPRDVVTWLEYCRSPEVQLPDGSWRELHMISSMGNAYTFPLETIIFSCVVSAAYKMKEISLHKGYREYCEYSREARAFVNTKRLPNFGVFGDDIIVKKECFHQTMKLLKLLGFTANAEKSFSEGPFRESCGGDYLRGHPVRGVYLKSLRSQASRYVAINRLNLYSAMHGIPLRRTVQRLVKAVRWLPIPLYENDDAGIKVPFHLSGVKLSRDKGLQSVVYRRWSTVQRKIRIKDGALKLPKGSKSRIYNPDGLLLAALRGDVRAYTFGSRLGPALYKPKVATTPYWDWLPTVGSIALPIGKGRLTDAIETNLTS